MSPPKPSTRGPKATLSSIDLGNGFGFWNTIPMRLRTSTASTPGAYRSAPRYSTLASTRAPGTRSFMRFLHRINELLPEPEGPISATISPAGTGNATSHTAGTPE
jgi:hypothetical protein